MPRYKLRTLLIVLALAPPLAAVAYWRFQQLSAFRAMHDLNATLTANNHFGDVPDNLGGIKLVGWLAILLVLVGAPATIIAIRRYGLTNRDLVWAMFAAALALGWFLHVQVKNRQQGAWYDQTLKQQATDMEWYRQELLKNESSTEN